MSDLTFFPPTGTPIKKSPFEKGSGKAEKTNPATPAQMHHELARYVVSWLGAIACVLLLVLILSFFLGDEKFKLLVPGLIGAISGIIGYIAGHTAKGTK
jgi:hypothetical protein